MKYILRQTKRERENQLFISPSSSFSLSYCALEYVDTLNAAFLSTKILELTALKDKTNILSKQVNSCTWHKNFKDLKLY